MMKAESSVENMGMLDLEAKSDKKNSPHRSLSIGPRENLFDTRINSTSTQGRDVVQAL
jgi:hypothetical protein